MTRPDVSVAVVSHNDARYLTGCLDSLAPERHSLQLEVFVVDNLSADETVPLVRERYSWVGLMENSRRQGFAANINQAIRRSSGRYVLVLNPDTEVRPRALERLVSFMEGNRRVGLCGPQLLFPDGSVQPSCRRFPTLGTVIVRRTPLRLWLRNSGFGQRHLMADVDIPAGRSTGSSAPP